MKKMRKKYPSIDDDLEIFKGALVSKLPDTLPGVVRISDLGQDVKVPIYKARHFRCGTLKGRGNRSGVRVIYAYEQDKDRITLIEVYHKSTGENEDRDRIFRYFRER